MPRFDLHLQQIDPTEQATRNAVFALDARNPIAISGPQKLLNRFLKLILTTQGSDPLHRKTGTDLPSLLGGNVLDEEDVKASVMLAVEDATTQIKEIDQKSPWLTASERLRAAELTAFREIGPTRYEVNVELTTTSGERVIVLLPFALD